jgi:hypothetical protein
VVTRKANNRGESGATGRLCSALRLDAVLSDTSGERHTCLNSELGLLHVLRLAPRAGVYGHQRSESDDLKRRDQIMTKGTLLLAAFFLLYPAASTTAAVILVPANEPTIQQGIDAATDGDTVLVAPGTYTGPLNRDIDFGGKALLLVSGLGAELTTIDCEDAGRGLCFQRGEGPSAIIDGFTITNGDHDDGGAMVCKGSSPTILRCVFSGNRSPDDGGALACYDSSPHIDECMFFGNNSELGLYGAGGAVICEAGSDLVVTRSVFRSNGSDMGGGICCRDGSTVVVTECLFYGNGADSGSALACRGGSAASVESCTITGNIGIAGTGVYCDGGSAVDVEATIMTFGTKGTAVVCATEGCVTLVCCDVFGNEFGDWVDCIAAQYGVDGNICLDPLFCGPLNPEERYSLRSDSPLDMTTWGRLKSGFRR